MRCVRRNAFFGMNRIAPRALVSWTGPGSSGASALRRFTSPVTHRTRGVSGGRTSAHQEHDFQIRPEGPVRRELQGAHLPPPGPHEVAGGPLVRQLDVGGALVRLPAGRAPPTLGSDGDASPPSVDAVARAPEPPAKSAASDGRGGHTVFRSRAHTNATRGTRPPRRRRYFRAEPPSSLAGRRRYHRRTVGARREGAQALTAGSRGRLRPGRSPDGCRR